MVETHDFEVDGVVIKVEKPGKNHKDWVVIKQEALSYDKGELILRKFNREFPQFDINDYEQLTEACSRTRKFSDWLIRANLEFSDYAQLPLFLKDKVSSSDFQKKQSELTKISKINSSYAEQKRLVSKKYRDDLKNLDRKEDNEIKEILDDDKILKVLSMNSTYLPFSLQLQIQGYTPNDLLNAQESRQSYGREVLIQYKKALIDAINNNPELDIDKIINENEVK